MFIVTSDLKRSYIKLQVTSDSDEELESSATSVRFLISSATRVAKLLSSDGSCMPSLKSPALNFYMFGKMSPSGKRVTLNESASMDSKAGTFRARFASSSSSMTS